MLKELTVGFIAPSLKSLDFLFNKHQYTMDDLEMEFLWVISMLSCEYKVQYHCTLYNTTGLLFCKDAFIGNYMPPNKPDISERIHIYTASAYYHKPSVQDKLEFLEDVFLSGIIEFVDDNENNHHADKGTILRNCCNKVIENSSVVFFISDYEKAIDGITQYALKKAKMKNKNIIYFNPQTLKFHDPDNVFLFSDENKYGFRQILE